MSVKTILHKLHLWLGLSSGLIVFIIAITGCIYAFQEEIQNATQPYRYVNKEDKPYLLPSQLKEIAENALPGKLAHSVIYPRHSKSAQVIFYHVAPFYYYSVFLNPYSGKILKVKDLDAGFFRIVLNGHYYLWLPPEIGQPVVASATLVFVILLISGMILWWPKKKNSLKQRFTIKWQSKWRRRNYDLHNVLGFYIFLIALVLALTGLVWGFEWFAKVTYWTASGGRTMVPYYESFSDTSRIFSQKSAPDKIWIKMKSEYPAAASIEIHFPESKKSVIAANANSEDGTFYKNDFRYFDQYTLEEIPVTHVWGRYKNADPGTMLLRMNYDIHTGAIAGLAGKCLAFFVSLITASLPITGFYVWWGRNKKLSRKNAKKMAKVKHLNPMI